jgi:hypothetical protein
VNLGQRLDRLDLDDHCFVDDNVESIGTIELHSVIDERHGALLVDMQSTLS